MASGWNKEIDEVIGDVATSPSRGNEPNELSKLRLLVSSTMSLDTDRCGRHRHAYVRTDCLHSCKWMDTDSSFELFPYWPGTLSTC